MQGASCAEHGLVDRVVFLGVLSGLEKFMRFAACDIFCFPSYFEAESFGLGTGGGHAVRQTGGQHPVARHPLCGGGWSQRLPGARSEILTPWPRSSCILGKDPDLRRRMGEEGRRIFEREFTLEAFHRAMERELLGLFEQQ